MDVDNSMPPVTKDAGVCGGAPSLSGTRISVHHVISQMRCLGWTSGRFLRSYPHLSLREIESALSYYEGHGTEIDALIAREDAEGASGRERGP